jgi:hypothetical protein
MTESRDLLMVMYDFIRLFRSGKIKQNDINEILQDVKNTYENSFFFYKLNFYSFFSVFQQVIIHMIMIDKQK